MAPRDLTPITDIELCAQMIRLRRAGGFAGGRYAAIPEDRGDMLRRLAEWVHLMGGAMWAADSSAESEHYHDVTIQIDDVLARARKSRPGAARRRREIRELVPGLVLTGVPDGWLHVVYDLARDLAGGHAGQEGRIAHGALRTVGADGWGRLVVEAELLDWTAARAVAVARREAQRVCQLCGQRGARERLLSWAGVVRACARHEP